MHNKRFFIGTLFSPLIFTSFYLLFIVAWWWAYSKNSELLLNWRHPFSLNVVRTIQSQSYSHFCEKCQMFCSMCNNRKEIASFVAQPLLKAQVYSTEKSIYFPMCLILFFNYAVHYCYKYLCVINANMSHNWYWWKPLWNVFFQ